MNSVQLANKVWKEVINYSILEQFHIDSGVERLGAEEPAFVRKNALVRATKRFQAIQAAMKELHRTPQNWPRHQELLQKIADFASKPITE